MSRIFILDAAINPLYCKFFFLERPPRAATNNCSYYQPTMAYRMRMFMSQKPSSVDLRVSDFKRVPGFNYVLPVSTV